MLQLVARKMWPAPPLVGRMKRMSEVNDGNTGDRFAAELKRVREAAGWTMEQMAARLGLGYAPGGRRVSTGRAYISAWESGKRLPPEQYVKAYIEFGGDPAILTARRARGQANDARDDSASVIEQPTQAPAPAGDVASNSRWRSGLRLRRRWLALPTVVVVAAAGISIYFAARTTAVPAPSGPGSTWTETTGTPAHTWADPVQLTGAGTPLGPRQSIQVSCRVRGYVVEDGDPWWYRIASAPWNGDYYATSDAFYNNGAVTGSVDTGVVVDEQVPMCSGSG